MNKAMQSLNEWVVAFFQPVSLLHPKFQRVLLWGRWALAPGVSGPAPLHCELCLFNQGVQQATLFRRSRCIVHCWAIPGACPSAPTLHFSGPALHRVGANFTLESSYPCSSQFSLLALRLVLLVQGAWHRGAVPGLGEIGSGLSPLGVCAPWCSDPSARCAVAMEIACAVARQLKHLHLHTAMPRNSQLSSLLSPFFDFSATTPLALTPLHSVTLLRFCGVNPVNPKKPTWHCKQDLWQRIQGWRS